MRKTGRHLGGRGGAAGARAQGLAVEPGRTGDAMVNEFKGLGLTERAGLPDALRVLVAEYPREGWASHANFQGTVAFWLDRHVMFRKISDHLREDAEALLDRAMEPRVYAGRMAKLAGILVEQLHMHHQVEDVHYFPVLQSQEPGIARGFDILDRDHGDLGGLLDRLVGTANGTLRTLEDPVGFRDKVGGFHQSISDFGGFLRRHLTDEEELVVPVILRHGADALPH